MTTSDESFDKNFKLNYTPGRCLICKRPVSSGLFCTTCCPTQKSPTKPSFSIVYQMEAGQSGFISPKDIFYDANRYWIFSDAVILKEADLEHTVQVRKTVYDKHLVNRSTFDRNKMGHFDQNKNCCIAFLEEGITTIEEMSDQQEGYTVSWAFVKIDHQLWVLKSASVTFIAQGQNTTRIQKNRGVIEVNSKTIDRDSIPKNWPKNNTKEYFTQAILLKPQ